MVSSTSGNIPKSFFVLVDMGDLAILPKNKKMLVVEPPDGSPIVTLEKVKEKILKHSQIPKKEQILTSRSGIPIHDNTVFKEATTLDFSLGFSIFIRPMVLLSTSNQPSFSLGRPYPFRVHSSCTINKLKWDISHDMNVVVERIFLPDGASSDSLRELRDDEDPLYRQRNSVLYFTTSSNNNNHHLRINNNINNNQQRNLEFKVQTFFDQKITLEASFDAVFDRFDRLEGTFTKIENENGECVFEYEANRVLIPPIYFMNEKGNTDTPPLILDESCYLQKSSVEIHSSSFRLRREILRQDDVNPSFNILGNQHTFISSVNRCGDIIGAIRDKARKFFNINASNIHIKVQVVLEDGTRSSELRHDKDFIDYPTATNQFVVSSRDYFKNINPLRLRAHELLGNVSSSSSSTTQSYLAKFSRSNNNNNNDDNKKPVTVRRFNFNSDLFEIGMNNNESSEGHFDVENSLVYCDDENYLKNFAAAIDSDLQKLSSLKAHPDLVPISGITRSTIVSSSSSSSSSSFNVHHHHYNVPRLIFHDYWDASLAGIISTNELTLSTSKIIVPSLCCALRHLHEHGVVAGSVRPENVLLELREVLFQSNTKLVVTRAALVDFGYTRSTMVLDKIITSIKTSDQENYMGQRRRRRQRREPLFNFVVGDNKQLMTSFDRKMLAAPELLLDSESPSCTVESDIWDFGILVLHMLDSLDSMKELRQATTNTTVCNPLNCVRDLRNKFKNKTTHQAEIDELLKEKKEGAHQLYTGAFIDEMFQIAISAIKVNPRERKLHMILE